MKPSGACVTASIFQRHYSHSFRISSLLGILVFSRIWQNEVDSFLLASIRLLGLFFEQNKMACILLLASEIDLPQRLFELSSEGAHDPV